MDFMPVLFVFFVLVFILILLIYSVYINLPLEFRYEDRPNTIFLYLRVLRIAWKRKQGQIELNSELAFAQERVELIAKDCRLDPNGLNYYKEICGYDKGNIIPACYLEVYFNPLMLILITCDEFKLSPIGLIHTGQSIKQHTSLEHLHKEPFDMELALTQCKPTDKGIQLQLSMKVYDRREMCIWEGITTLLSRNEKVKQSGSHKPAGDVQTDLIRKNEVLEEKLQANLGRRFARASGDFNPHHLYGWTARLLGYKEPIAHGMWTMARCLAHIQSSGIFPVKPPFHVSVEFKRPVFLPSTSVFTFLAQANKDSYRFKVEDKETRAPQLLGYIQRS